jgi:hypothetical protein
MTTKKKVLVGLTILAVVAALMILAYLLANSQFNLIDFLKKLHGG